MGLCLVLLLYLFLLVLHTIIKIYKTLKKKVSAGATVIPTLRVDPRSKLTKKAVG